MPFLLQRITVQTNCSCMETWIAVRTNGGEFIPKVHKKGTYTLVVGFPETGKWEEDEVSDVSKTQY